MFLLDLRHSVLKPFSLKALAVVTNKIFFFLLLFFNHGPKPINNLTTSKTRRRTNPFSLFTALFTSLQRFFFSFFFFLSFFFLAPRYFSFRRRRGTRFLVALARTESNKQFPLCSVAPFLRRILSFRPGRELNGEWRGQTPLGGKWELVGNILRRGVMKKDGAMYLEKVVNGRGKKAHMCLLVKRKKSKNIQFEGLQVVN